MESRALKEKAYGKPGSCPVIGGSPSANSGSTQIVTGNTPGSEGDTQIVAANKY